MLEFQHNQRVTEPASFSDAAHLPARIQTIVDIARWRAEEPTHEFAFRFLIDGEQTTASMSFEDLDQRARSIASVLQSRGGSGERVLLLFHPGLDLVAAVYGCLYAGAVAVPVPPPDPLRLSRTLPRLRAIVGDAAPKLVVGPREILQLADGEFRGQSQPEAIEFETLEYTQPSEWHGNAISAQHPVVLQYTSGSTGTPHGVVLTHAHLMHSMNSILSCDAEGREAGRRLAVSWLPPYHDMGLIGCILMPIFANRPTVFMSPLSFIERPLRWLRAISAYRAEVTAGPNFAYELCARRATPSECEGLDLSCWRIAVVGAEPVRADTLDRFVEVFSPYGFRREAFLPAYGLAEAVVDVTGIQSNELPLVRSFSARGLEAGHVRICPDTAPDARRLVGTGPARPEERLEIVDPDSRRPLPPNRVGEIWFQSPHVGLGYWQRPEETQRVFRAEMAIGDCSPFLRTGDLGFIHEDQLFIVGRLKELIIQGGRNFCPQDIEQVVLQSHSALATGRAMAFSCEIDEQEQLVVVCEMRRSRRKIAGSVLASIRREIAHEYLFLPYAIVLVPGGVLPWTSSGKPRRMVCREKFLAGELDILAEWRASGDSDISTDGSALPRTLLEREIATAVQEVLQLEAVGIHDDLFALGLSSLLLTELIIRLQHWAPHGVPLASLVDRPTVSGLADLILTAHLEHCPETVELLEELENMTDEEARHLMTNAVSQGPEQEQID